MAVQALSRGYSGTGTGMITDERECFCLFNLVKSNCSVRGLCSYYDDMLRGRRWRLGRLGEEREAGAAMVIEGESRVVLDEVCLGYLMREKSVCRETDSRVETVSRTGQPAARGLDVA